MPGGLPPFPEHVKQAVLTLGNGSRRRREALEAWLKALFAVLNKDRDIFYDAVPVDFFGGYICLDLLKDDSEIRDKPVTRH